MSEPDGNPRAGGALIEEAAAWFARMRAPDAEGSRADFEAWLARGALHRAAYNRASEIFAMGKVLSDDHGGPGAAPQRKRKPNRRLSLLLTVASLAAIAATSLLFRPADIAGVGRLGNERGRREVAELTNGDSGPREVRLADGSLVELQRASRLDIAIDSAGRRLSLVSGGARFKVAHESRPFVVFAGGGSVTAHGTIFDVALLKDRRVSVRLIEGIVDVQLPRSPESSMKQPTIHQLHRGESLSFVAGADARERGSAIVSSASTAPADNSLADAHDYDGIRVADLIADANSNASRPIRLSDPIVGEKRLSGRFSIDDTDLLAKRLAALFGLAVDLSDPAVIVLKRK